MGVPGVNALKITRLESNIDVVPSILKMMGQRSRKIFTIFSLASLSSGISNDQK